MDAITELADRLLARQRRGEEWGLEFEIEYGALTDEERSAFDALVEQRIAHGQERLEAIEATNAALKALLRLLVGSDAPPGATLAEALDAGHIGWLDVVDAIHGVVPNPT